MRRGAIGGLGAAFALVLAAPAAAAPPTLTGPTPFAAGNEPASIVAARRTSTLPPAPDVAAPTGSPTS